VGTLHRPPACSNTSSPGAMRRTTRFLIRFLRVAVRADSCSTRSHQPIVSHIPIAFDVLGILATLYVLALTFEAKTRDLRTQRPGPGQNHTP
jgi:hypothetical protein